MNGTKKKILRRFIHDFKGFVKDGEVAKINECVVEMGENDIEVLLNMVLDEFPNVFFLNYKGMNN
jgi:hypothetical protein